jgi:hypothetical protein
MMMMDVCGQLSDATNVGRIEIICSDAREEAFS